MREVLKLPPREGAPEFRILRPGNTRGYHALEAKKLRQIEPWSARAAGG